MGLRKDIKDGRSLCGTANFCGLIAIAVMTLGIAKIVMGTIYLHDCDIESMIPVFLIVSGCMSLLVGYLAKQRNEKKRRKITITQYIGVFGLFSIAWLTAGSIWVLPNWRKLHLNPCDPDVTSCIICNTDLLNFAAAVTIIDWMFMWLFIVSIFWICIRGCCESLKLTKKSDDSIRIAKTNEYIFPAKTGSGKDIKDGRSLCGAATFCGLIVIAVMTMGIAKIVMGTIYLHDCDIDRQLPIFLILSGFMVLIYGYLARQGVEENHETIIIAQLIGFIGLIWSSSWLIIGSFDMFPNWRKLLHDNPCRPDNKSCITCNTDLLTFALAVTMIDWVLMGLFFISFFYIWIRVNCKILNETQKKSDDRIPIVTTMQHLFNAKMGSGKNIKDRCYLLSTDSVCYWCVSLIQGTLGILKIVTGIIYLQDCDIERMIPIFLIVSGFISLMLLSPALHENRENHETRTIFQMIGSFLHFFSIPWLIAGSVLVFLNWRKLQDNPCKPNDKSCITCNTGNLTFASAVIITDWVLIGLFLISYFFRCFCARRKPVNQSQKKSVYRIWIVKTKEHLFPAKMGSGEDFKDDTPPFCGLIIIVVMILGMAKIVMGTIYLHDCDIERMIPIFLIVSGCIPLIFFTFDQDELDENWENWTIPQVIVFLLVLFNIPWLIAGSVWVFRSWRKLQDNPCKPDVTSCITCNTDLLTFSAAVTIIDWLFVGMFCVYSDCINNCDKIVKTKEHLSPAKIGPGIDIKDEQETFSRCEGWIIGAVIILEIAKIVIGIIYLHDCDIERMIPIFLIVSGCMPFMLCFLTQLGDEKSTITQVIFHLAWLIAGSVWVFPNWRKFHDNPCKPDVTSCITCNTDLLTFAAAVTIIHWVFVGMVLVFIFYICNRVRVEQNCKHLIYCFLYYCACGQYDPMQ